VAGSLRKIKYKKSHIKNETIQKSVSKLKQKIQLSLPHAHPGPFQNAPRSHRQRRLGGRAESSPAGIRAYPAMGCPAETLGPVQRATRRVPICSNYLRLQNNYEWAKKALGK
jgi:hypothetical protein